MRSIREFVCWQLAEELKCQLFDLTAIGPASRDFKFRDQIRDAAASATANMAEGFEYFKPAQFARFLSYAVGSLGETQDRLLDARNRGYVDEKRFSTLNNLAAAAKRLTINLMLAKQREAEEARRQRRRPSRQASQRRPQRNRRS